MKLITGTISHETNTLALCYTGLNDFNVLRGEEVFEHFRGTRTSVGGFLDGCAEHGIELVPTIYASGRASGTIIDEAFDTLLGELLDGIKDARPFDGVVLHLHGAGVSESHDDIEGRILYEVRSLVGDEMPLVSTFDFHANYTKLMVDSADVLIGYDTYPHIDGYERGLEAIQVMRWLIDGSLKPTKAFRQPPMLPAARMLLTDRYPMKRIMEAAHKMEAMDGVETITVAGGFRRQDVKHAGKSIIVTTNNDQELADKCADELSDLAWSMRLEFLLKGMSTVREGIQRVRSAKKGPIVLADTGDTAGGGASTEGTVVLKAVLEAGLENGVLHIADPEVVEKAIEAGVGNEVTMDLGGKKDKRAGAPLRVTGLVKLVSDGKYIRKGPMGTGSESNMGRTAVVRIDGVDIIITGRPYYPTDLQCYRSLGIEPTEKKFIVVKGVGHFYASHGPISKEIILLDTPGITSARLAGYGHKKIKRPIFPLDVETLGIVSLKTWEEE